MRWVSLIAIIFVGVQCADDVSVIDPGDLTSIPFDPNPFILQLPDHFPEMPVPAGNPLTQEGVLLGRHLFYDTALSKDGSMSCASCHLPTGNFTDNLAVSKGVDGINGTRSSMSLLNVGFNTRGFFWDGRAASLEEQALLPVEDPIELHISWKEVEARLRSHDTYPSMFRKAFGIQHENEITSDLAAKAIAQFERTLVSSGESKYDRVISGEEVFTDEELRGHNIFFDIDPDVRRHAECGHCHNAPLFTTNEYFNNGLDEVTDLASFLDKGRGDFTGVPFDNGTFRVPTLRNIFHSAPYMHDGRFETIDEVIDHYVAGGHTSPNRAPILRPLNLSDEDRAALIAFIKTLEDPGFMSNPAYQNPF